MPLHEFFKHHKMYPFFEKNDDITLDELLKIQQKINSKYNSYEK